MYAAKRFGLALLPWLGILEPAVGNPVPLQATLALISEAQIEGRPLQYDRMSMSEVSALDELNFVTNVVASSPAGTAQAFTSADAIWQDPSTGTVSFGPTGFQSALDDIGTVTINGSHWSYRFDTDGEDQLLLDYDVELTGDTTDPTGLSGFRFVVILEGYLPIFDQVIAPGSTGTFIIPLDPSDEYTVSLVPQASLTTNLQTRTAAMTGDFAFEIGIGP